MQEHSREGADPRASHGAPFNNLAKTGWLSETPALFRGKVAEIGQWRRIDRGRRLFYAGDPPDAIYGLEDGILDLALPVSAQEECRIFRASPGFWIGDGALVSRATRTLSVETASDCLLYRVPFSALLKHLEDHPADWRHIHHLATLNGILAIRVLSEVLTLPPQARIARALLRLADKEGSVASTQEELGELVGVSRATFRRAVRDLVASGAVDTRYGHVRIVDRAAVEWQAEL